MPKFAVHVDVDVPNREELAAYVVEEGNSTVVCLVATCVPRRNCRERWRSPPLLSVGCRKQAWYNRIAYLCRFIGPTGTHFKA
jgi:hypothetical protein